MTRFHSSSNHPYLQDIIVLMEAVSEELVKFANYQKLRKVSYKKSKEIVSDLDISIEKKIRKKFKKILPKYKVWGEELGKDSGDLSKDSFIIVDPLDGTKNYLSGIPLYSTQIAGFTKGKLDWGIIVLPAFQETFVGIKGKGSWLNGRAIKPSSQTNLSLANQCFGLGHDATNIIKLPALIKPFLAEPRQLGSAGVHFAYTACGRIDIYIAQEAGFYDIAPGLIICQEAGLTTSDLKGHLYQIDEGQNTGLVVANKHLIKAYQKALS